MTSCFDDGFGAGPRHRRSPFQQAGTAAGVRRIVTLSIVGIDGLGGGPFGHYDGKQAQEATTEAGAVPTSILRATQFHDFAGQLIDWMAKGPFMPVTRQPSQTVDLDTVVSHLIALADDTEADARVRRDLAGPQRQEMADLVRATARARGRRLVLVPVWLPGESAKKVRAGALQAPVDAIIDGPTFDEWLSTAYPH